MASPQENGVESSCRVISGEKTQNGEPKNKTSRVRRLSKRLSAYFSSLTFTEESNEKPQTNGDSTSPLCKDGRAGFYVGTYNAPRSRAMSESDSMRRKLIEEDIMSGSKLCGFEAASASNSKTEGGKNYHQSVRRVSSMPITCSPSQTTPPFDRLHLYEKLEQLGEGSYATVYKGISKVNKMYVALKEIRLQQEEGAPFTAIREASLLKQLKHVNVVRLHDIIHTNRNLTLVFEYLHTDLCQYLEKYPNGLHKQNVKLFLFQLLRGLSYIHKGRILHRDLKPQNLLLSEQGDLKLADFGLARSKTVPSRTYSSEVVTLWYRPPDVLCGSKTYSTSLDVWGVGCIFLEMITGFPLFPGTKGVKDQLDKIWKVCGSPDGEWYSTYNLFTTEDFDNYSEKDISAFIPRLNEIDGAEDIASKMIQCHPERRITCDEALRHSYFSDLPKEVYVLPNSASIFTVNGIVLEKEIERPRETRGGVDESSKGYMV
ncbi:cyclin-dependent kinase 14-like isoform X2 [Rhopilema esculentum]|uniref:cyclin-dependent kinase 14-like isoform X2 n=1 Tax=Rhopilema esculentum TaxID=499914 RepID=UPI0031DF90B8